MITFLAAWSAVESMGKKYVVDKENVSFLDNSIMKKATGSDLTMQFFVFLGHL